MNLIPNELEEDSEDLSDVEVDSAVPVASVDTMLEHLREIRCHECEGAIEADEHALRRRAPYFYARMNVRCKKEHSRTVIFRADWLSS